MPSQAAPPAEAPTSALSRRHPDPGPGQFGDREMAVVGKVLFWSLTARVGSGFPDLAKNLKGIL